MGGDWFALRQCQFWSLLSSNPLQDHFHKEPSGHQWRQAFPHVISLGFLLRSIFRLKDTSAHWPQGSRVDRCLIHEYHPPVKQDKMVTATPFKHTYIAAQVISLDVMSFIVSVYWYFCEMKLEYANKTSQTCKSREGRSLQAWVW